MKREIVTFTLGVGLLLSCGNARKAAPKAQAEPKRYTYEVVAVYPHLRSSYTQGLQFIDGEMWEGTGEYGESRLQRIDLATGEAEVVASLPGNEFGEGITLLGDHIYQLTWQNRKMHIYDRATGKRLRDMPYSGEGWGLTSDGEQLYMSDGTSTIRVINPQTGKQSRSFIVRYNGRPIDYLNELEWIDSRIWANVYTLDQIVIINPESGDIEGVINLTGLLREEDIDASTDVLNGIAYDAASGRIFVTGKRWNKIFEIKIIEI